MRWLCVRENRWICNIYICDASTPGIADIAANAAATGGPSPALFFVSKSGRNQERLKNIILSYPVAAAVWFINKDYYNVQLVTWHNRHGIYILFFDRSTWSPAIVASSLRSEIVWISSRTWSVLLPLCGIWRCMAPFGSCCLLFVVIQVHPTLVCFCGRTSADPGLLKITRGLLRCWWWPRW